MLESADTFENLPIFPFIKKGDIVACSTLYLLLFRIVIERSQGDCMSNPSFGERRKLADNPSSPKEHTIVHSAYMGNALVVGGCGTGGI